MPNASETTCLIVATETGTSASGQVAQRLAHEGGAGRAARQRGVGEHARERALELADVRRHAPGDGRQQLGIGDAHVVGRHALVQDRDARLDVGRLDVDEQAPLEARAQAVGQLGDLARRAVGAQHELPAARVQRVEGVEELLLDAVLAGQEVDVVDQQDVELLAVAPLEGVHALVLDGGDELVRERLAGHVARAHARRVHEHVVRDGLQQVRLAEAGVAVDHERVVGLPGRLGDGQRRGVREAVGAADHERAEGVLRAQRLGLLGAPAALPDSALASRARLGAPPRPRRAGAGSPSATRKRTDTPGSAAVAARRTSSAKCPSIQERVNSFGHADLEHVAVQRERPGGREPGAEDHRREVVADAVGDRGPEEVRCVGVYGHGNARPRRKRVSIAPCGRGEGSGC